ncbi:ribonuclease H-like domain-containing protein [Aspergillus lucknowensis]|uniref:Ribonuclease H-like domain-containing protein n=1 Tax=Aspergillus lucknowensis TaxID=176173 RepID=A0ABR4LY81_9EURO
MSGAPPKPEPQPPGTPGAAGKKRAHSGSSSNSNSSKRARKTRAALTKIIKSPNLAPDRPVPQIVTDAKRALEWLYAEAKLTAAVEGRWRTLTGRQQVLSFGKLLGAVHSLDVLKRNGYPMGPVSAPEHNPNLQPPKRQAVAIDCEMVGVRNAEDGTKKDYLIQVCAVDFLTGEPLLVKVVVLPAHFKVDDWRTTYSGMSQEVFDFFKMNGEAVEGIEGVQKALYEFIDEDTILVGHALHNDLKHLGIVHHNVCDTAIFTQEVVSEHLDKEDRKQGARCGRTWKLSTLCRQLLERPVQVGNHICLEDAYAAREVLLWCLEQKNETCLNHWAKERKEEGGFRLLYG